MNREDIRQSQNIENLSHGEVAKELNCMRPILPQVGGKLKSGKVSWSQLSPKLGNNC